MARYFYETRGLNVDPYEERAEHLSATSVVGDIDFYVALAREVGGPVLELACGTGRVVLPIARAGSEVVGLDLSDGMLRVAAERLAREPEHVRANVSLVHGDMRHFELGQQFPLIIIAFRSFQMLLAPEDEQACLDSVRRHLRPSGKLVIDIFDPLLDLLLPGDAGPPVVPRIERGGTHADSGNRVRVEVVNRRNNTVAQTFEELWRFTAIAADGSVVRAEDELLSMRWIYRWEMRYLLERQGFRVEAEYSDFKKSPPAYGKEQVWIATPA